MLISLDPGKKGAGLAAFEDRELSFACYCKGADWEKTAWSAYSRLTGRYPLAVLRIATVVIEIMHYSQRQTRSPNDLIKVAHMAGAFVGYMGPAINLIKRKPYEWKGSVPKEITTERVRKRLSPEEFSRIEWPTKSLRHNVWDVVGIGLHELRR